MVLVCPSSEALSISQQATKMSDAKGRLFPFFTNYFYSFLVFLYLFGHIYKLTYFSDVRISSVI